MENRTAPLNRTGPDDHQYIDSIIETDTLIEAQISELERLLECRRDASLELAQLRKLRQSCTKVKELIRKYE
jgi:hypothetical protein